MPVPPQLGEIVFNTMKYRSSETVQRPEYKILKVEVTTVRSKSQIKVISWHYTPTTPN